MIDVRAAYDEVAERIADVVLELDTSGSSAPVRSCPGWTVHDVLAHHVGAVVDASTGNAPEIPAGLDFHRDFDEVIGTVFADVSARQVAERATRSIGDLVAEWRPAARTAWAICLGELPDRGYPIPAAVLQGVMVNDAVVHEGDVRQALGLPPAPESAALSVALSGYALLASTHLQKAGLGAISLEYDGREKLLGTGDPVLTLRAPRHDLVRVLAGRRSREQILAMDWDGDPTDHADHLSAYGVVSPEDADVL